jgi:predicted phosphodiesterase
MRYLIIADIHANLAAFETVLAAAGNYDEIWCLGDLVGYGPDPEACVELLRQKPHVAVAGNHDWATIGRLDMADFNPAARAAIEWTAEHIGGDTRAYLQSLPVRERRGDFTLVHGSPRAPIWEYVDEPSVALENMEHFDTPHCLVGHSHIPMLYVMGERRGVREVFLQGDMIGVRFADARSIFNPGSVGQPRDGDPRAAYAVLDSDTGLAELHRVEYPVQVTQRRMLKVGLPTRSAYRLTLGR